MEVKVRPASAKFNPAPRPQRETENNHAEIELQKIIDGIIDEDYLLKLCGTKSLHDVDHLKLKVNTSYQSVVDLHNLLPSLKNLILDQSTIISIRDLGVGLKYLSVLSLNDCGLSDIDGIGVLAGLQELRLRDNLITDVTPLAMHENIEVIDLSGNKVTDISVADILSSCPRLQSLDLRRNPITRAPQYRPVISSMIGNLTTLDGSPVDPVSRSKVTSVMVLEAVSAMQQLAEEIDDEERLEMEIGVMFIPGSEVDDRHERSHTNGIDKYNEMVKSDYAYGDSAVGVVTPAVIGSSRQTLVNSSVLPDTGSALTHGSTVVLAGNMAVAMRQRKRREMENSHRTSASASTPPSSSTVKTENHHFVPVHDDIGFQNAEVETSPSTGNRHSYVSKQDHKLVSGLGSDDDHGTGAGESESTLAVLDSALKADRQKYRIGNQRTATSNGGSNSSSSSSGNDSYGFLGEGDVTHNAALRGSAPLHKDAIAAIEHKHAVAEALALGIDIDTATTSASSSSSSSSSAEGREIAEAHGSLPRTPSRDHIGISISEQRAAGEGSDDGRLWEDKWNRSDNKHYSDLDSSNALHIDSGDNTSISSLRSRPGTSTGTRTPRQKNGDRPVSAASHRTTSTASDSGAWEPSGRPIRAPSASFKIAADGERLKSAGIGIGSNCSRPVGWSASHSPGYISSQANNRVRTRGVDFGSLFGGIAMEGGRKHITTKNDGDDDSAVGDDKDRKDRLRVKQNLFDIDEDENHDNGAQPGRSIVHRDIVKRSYNPKSHSKPPVSKFNENMYEMDAECDIKVDNSEDYCDADSDADNSDAEGSDDGCTAIAHAARHRLMSASASRAKATNRPLTATQLGKSLSSTTQRDALILASPEAQCDDNSEPSSERKRASNSNSNSNTRTANGSPSIINTSSARAGASLGFDLQGSLAAIGKWVDAMDSEADSDNDDDDDDNDEHEEDYGGAKHNSHIYGSRHVTPLHRGNGADGDRKSNSNGGEAIRYGAGKATVMGTVTGTATDFDNLWSRRTGLSQNSSRPDSAGSKGGSVNTATSNSNNNNNSSSSTGTPARILSKDVILKMCSTSNATANVEVSSSNVRDEKISFGENIRSRNSSRGSSFGDIDITVLNTEEKCAPSITLSQTPVKRDRRDRGSTAKNLTHTESAGDSNAHSLSNSRAHWSKKYDHGVDASLEGVTGSVPCDPSASLQASFIIEDTSAGSAHVHDESNGLSLSSPTTSSPPNQCQCPKESSVGEAVYRNDEELIDMLSRPPKSIPALRTKSSFQEFFRGMKSSRMLSLLERTYAGAGTGTGTGAGADGISTSADIDISEAQRAAKIKKRMDIVRDVLVD